MLLSPYSRRCSYWQITNPPSPVMELVGYALMLCSLRRLRWWTTRLPVADLPLEPVMAKLLYLECSPRKTSSASIEVATAFLEAYRYAHPDQVIYATTPEEIALRRKAFIRKWRLKHRAVADSMEEAGDRLFTFARLPPS